MVRYVGAVRSMWANVAPMNRGAVRQSRPTRLCSRTTRFVTKKGPA